MRRLSAFLALLAAAASARVANAQIQQPVLKWELGACDGVFCDTGWYSCVAAVDLEGDGSVEVVAASYTVAVLEGATGAVRWQAQSGHAASETGVGDRGRTWSGVIVADIDGDNALEIATGHENGWLSVYEIDGSMSPGWPRQRPNGGEARAVAAGDLDGDGSLELVVGKASGGATNVWAFEHDGSIRAGWPQLVSQPGFSAGVYNANIAIGNMSGDALPEIVVPSDVHYICAYDGAGGALSCNPLYTSRTRWGQIGAYADFAYELQGFGPCGEEYTTRGNFANGAATLADMDGDGTIEVIVVGNVHDCNTDPYTDVYMGPYIFNADRSRFNGGPGRDWTSVPIDTGSPLSQDFGTIENIQQNAVAADLDGDGEKEFLFPSYDGRLHAYWLDKTERGDWPLEITQQGEGVIRFASEPAVADLDNDGQAEVIVATWTQKGSNQSGHLIIASSSGAVLQQVALPPPASGNWNGALGCPTLANIDGDPDLEVVLNTAHSGVVAYDLPGTANARVLWGTGRGSLLRNGVAAVAPSPSGLLAR